MTVDRRSLTRKSAPLLALMALSFSGACSKRLSGPENSVPPNGFHPVPTEITSSPMRTSDLNLIAGMGETVPATGQLIWMKKSFWLNRKIWISLGVERASVTGLAMSVMGYIPAELEVSGGELVVKKQAKGLFGGSALAPDFVINSYPIVADRDDALLVDLSKPKSPYGLSTVGLDSGTSSNDELEPRIEYTKSSEFDDNRVSFTNVFVSKSPEALFDKDEDSAEARAGLDPFTLSATIRTDWLTELSAPNFNPLGVSDSIFGFFKGSPLVIDNGSDVAQFVNQIDTSKKMIWTMSGNTPEVYRDSIKAGAQSWNQALDKDVLEVQAGSPDVTSYTNPKTSNIVWDDNEAIGMAFANWRSNPYTGEIVQAQVYLSGNMWASNAKTLFKMRTIEKRIREQLEQQKGAAPAPVSPDDPSPPPFIAATPAAPGARLNLVAAKTELARLMRSSKELPLQESTHKRFILGWNRSLSRQQAEKNEFCFRQTESGSELAAKLSGLQKLEKDLSAAAVVAADSGIVDSSTQPEAIGPAPAPPTALTSTVVHSPYPLEGETDETFSKNVLRAVVMHEVGHTMGLRHNFVGSMESSEDTHVDSASIMDYNDLVIDAQFTKPGINDVTVIKGVYGSADEKAHLKNIRFCSDEQSRKKVPGCTPFDFAQNNLDGFKVQEETNLLIAYKLLSMGQSGSGIGMIKRAARDVVPVIQYMTFPTEQGAAFLRDEKFQDKQKQAFELYQNSKGMLTQPYPEDLKAVYGQLLVQILAKSVNEQVAESALFPEILEELSQTALDSTGIFELATRKAALLGLQNIQDLKARAALVSIRDQLQKKLADETAELAPKMTNEEVLTIVQGILTRGYFKEPKE